VINVIINFNSYFLGRTVFLLLATTAAVVIDAAIAVVVSSNNVGWRKWKVYLDVVEIDDSSPVTVPMTPDSL
jgi:hypothetical protein